MTILDKMKEEKRLNEERKLKKNNVTFTLKGRKFEFYYITDDTFKIIVDGVEQSNIYGKGDFKSIIERVFNGKYPKEVLKWVKKI